MTNRILVQTVLLPLVMFLCEPAPPLTTIQVMTVLSAIVARLQPIALFVVLKLPGQCTAAAVNKLVLVRIPTRMRELQGNLGTILHTSSKYSLDLKQ